jgi:hypothetical protein
MFGSDVLCLARLQAVERSGGVRAGIPARHRRTVRPGSLVTARSATPRQAGASARAPRAPGQADPAEATKAEATGAEPLAEQRERVRRPAAPRRASANAAFGRRLRRARCQPGAAGSPWGTLGGRRRDAAQQRGAEERRRRRGSAERRVPRPTLRAHAAAHGAGLYRTERKRRRKQTA